MKLVLMIVAVSCGLVFVAGVLSVPFAWRFGSWPAVSHWLRVNLPSWLLAKLDRSERDDQTLCLRFAQWLANIAWFAGLATTLLALALYA